ncbi:MAG TPA: ATP-binding protein [Candidatus Dormibacteraeota bacterium]|nr:ATP-binding protein [Candidatus Dormibacteraeota bacterium]
MTRPLPHSYEGQIKIFLVLLVLFLSVAIVLDFHLLVSARDAIQEEVGRRVALEADVVRAELERDQMLRGLRAEPGTPPYIPPAFLDLMARQKGMLAIEILTTEGKVLSSSDAARVGRPDPLIAGNPAAAARLRSGGGLVAQPERLPRSRYTTLAAYGPIQDRSRATIAVVRVLTEVPALGSVAFNLTLIAAFQAAGLVFILTLVILFARWLLQPYRRLLRAAVQAPGQVPGPPPEGGKDEPDYLVEAFQGVLDKLRAQEQELTRLKVPAGPVSQSTLPGDHLVGGMSSAVLVFDRGGRLTVLNPAAERLLSFDRSASVGRKYGDLLGGAERLIELIERSLRTGESLSREVVPLTGPGGKVTHLGVMVSPIRPGDEAQGGPSPIEGVLCLLADLTEIKSLREKVGLKENLAVLGEMSAGIAHEFRNALATIHGLARLILKGNGNGAGHAAAPREHAETILREVEGIEKVVTDFLRYARPLHLNLSEVDLKEVIDNLARDLAEDARTAGVTLTVGGTFPRIVADEALIRQAVRNLLLNALESFTATLAGGDVPAPDPTDGRRVVVRCEAITGGEGGVRIVVRDNGAGIAAEDLPRIFTPFFTTKEKGTGLGLALVQKTAVVHDGQVEVQSEKGHGASFALVLPARPGGGAALPDL